MGLYKQGKSKQWWMSFSVNGRQARESTGTTNKRLAGEVLAKRKTEVFEGRYFPSKKKLCLTFKQLQAMWVEAAADKKSLEDDKTRFQAIEEFFGSDTSISAVEASDVESFKAHLKSTITRRGIPMASATVNRHLALLRAALNLAAKRGYLHQNPMGSVKMLREENKRNRVCSKQEYNQLMVAADPELRLAICLAYFTGMRQGEIVGLEWKHINRREKIIRLAAKATKTNSERVVPLAQEALQELSDWPRNLDGRVFSVVPATIASRFRLLVQRLALEDLRFHDLRHSCATNLRRAGVDLFTIRQITGHKSLAMLERYNTVTADDLVEAVGRLGNGS